MTERIVIPYKTGIAAFDMGLFGNLFPKKPEVSLDSVKFDISRYTRGDGHEGVRVWHTPDGDGIGLFYFAKPPDLPAGLSAEAELKEFYLKIAEDYGATLVEFELLPVSDHIGVRTIMKMVAQPGGATYIGSITLPFADFSFVVKMQCPERGTTGLREAALLDKALGEGTVTVDDNGALTGDFNPDHPQYDELFPDHPLSRLRCELSAVAATLEICEPARSRRPFPIPGGIGG